MRMAANHLLTLERSGCSAGFVSRRVSPCLARGNDVSRNRHHDWYFAPGVMCLASRRNRTCHRTAGSRHARFTAWVEPCGLQRAHAIFCQ